MTFSMSISLECTRSVDSRWRTPSESISQIKWRNPFFTRGHSRMRYYSPRANTHSRLIDRKIIKIIGINRIERRGTSNKLRHRLHWLNWTNIYLFFFYFLYWLRQCDMSERNKRTYMRFIWHTKPLIKIDWNISLELIWKKKHTFSCDVFQSVQHEPMPLIYYINLEKKKWIWQNTPLFCCLECSPSPQVRGTHKKSHSAITKTTSAAWFWLRCVVRTNACIIFVIDWKKIGIMMSARRLSSVFDWMKINQNQMGKT